MKSSRPMVYAPVTIPTLCRYEHFVRCLESLRRNRWAQYTDVYIGLDYPAKEAHWDGYRKIGAYLEQPFPEFRSVHVFRREKNVGASFNSRLLREEALRTCDRYIYMEDDLEVSPNYLEYMDKALMAYEDDPTVAAVSGYAYPLNWKCENGCTVAKQNFNASTWGIGIWQAKRRVQIKYLRSNGLSKDFSRAYRNGCFDKMIDYAVKDYVNICENGWSGRKGFLNNLTDVAMRIYLAVRDQYVVMPLVSKVRNHGYDGSGVFCQRIEGSADGDFCVDNYVFSAQPIDESDSFTIIEDQLFDKKANRDLLNRFDRVSSEEMKGIWNRAKRIASRGRYGGVLLLGKKAVKKMKIINR